MSSNKTPTHSEPFLPAKTLYQLQEEHAHSLFKEISLLENLVTIVQKKPSEKNIQTLQQTVHNLASISALSGYLEISTICKQFEKEILEVLKTKKPVLEKTHLSQITNAFQKTLSPHSLSTKIRSCQAKVATIGLGYLVVTHNY